MQNSQGSLYAFKLNYSVENYHRTPHTYSEYYIMYGLGLFNVFISLHLTCFMSRLIYDYDVSHSMLDNSK